MKRYQFIIRLIEATKKISQHCPTCSRYINNLTINGILDAPGIEHHIKKCHHEEYTRLLPWWKRILRRG